MVGILVGDAIGESETIAVGLLVDILDGMHVGTFVDDEVGDLVINNDGLFEGDEVDVIV